jgi:hypothetical protein
VGDRRFRNEEEEEEVNMAVREWLLMPGFDFYTEGNIVTLKQKEQIHRCAWKLC